MKFYVVLIAVAIVLMLIYMFFQTTGFVTKTTVAQCTDSDGGKAYFTYGRTYGLDSEAKVIGTQEDFCEDNYVHEFYCNANWVYTDVYFCTRGCQDGECTYGTPIIP